MWDNSVLCIMSRMLTGPNQCEVWKIKLLSTDLYDVTLAFGDDKYRLVLVIIGCLGKE